jgi:hydroxymethylbilane synthase
LVVELKIITTKGDRILDVALSAVGDKGLFVKELEQELLAGSVDLCVHSAKDLPSQLPPGLTLAAFPEREDARDVLVLGNPRVRRQESEGIADTMAVPAGARVGTSSLRRACQLRALRPDLRLSDVRGNVDTRLRKLAEGQFDAIVLAAAGLRRLHLWDGGLPTFNLDEHSFAVVPLDPTLMLPAVAQGTLAIEARADDAATLALLAVLDHAPTRAAALAERAFLRRLEGGCQVPIAAHARIEGALLQLEGLIGALDGSEVVRGTIRGDVASTEALGIALAEKLLARGAERILAELASNGR